MFLLKNGLQKMSQPMCGFLAAILILAGASEVWALKIYSHTDGDGFTSVDVYDDDGLSSTSYYGPDGEYIGTYFYEDDAWDFSNPNPDDSSAGTGMSDEELDALIEMMKDLESSGFEQEEIWDILVLLGALPNDMGPNVIDPYDLGVLATAFDETGTGSAFDPNVPFGEQFPTNPTRTDEEEEDEDEDENSTDRYMGDPSSYGEYYGLSPELVNPVPALNR